MMYVIIMWKLDTNVEIIFFEWFSLSNYIYAYNLKQVIINIKYKSLETR